VVAGQKVSTDLREDGTGAPLTVNLHTGGWNARRATPVLVAGGVPDPRQGAAFMAAVSSGIEGTLTDEGMAQFGQVPAGQYTLLILQAKAPLGVYRQALEVPESQWPIALDVNLPSTAEGLAMP
jgi:hypothetical protein